VTRSLFNYLVPMIQDKQAEEAEENEGDRPGQISQKRGQLVALAVVASPQASPEAPAGFSL
jgi:hypothetical protein